MQLLMVEDDQNKLLPLTSFVQEGFPQFEISISNSLVAGLRAARSLKPDVVLLDMTLPNFDGASGSSRNQMRAFGGVEFIRQAKRLNLKTNIIVFTQFESFGEPPDVTLLEDLSAELKAQYSEIYRGAVYYHASQASWRGKLEKQLNGIVE